MFIKTSFVITIISDLLTLMKIPIRTFECKLWEPLLLDKSYKIVKNLVKYARIRREMALDYQFCSWLLSSD